jgi:4-amino-4-deoxy-L-arabinose transferase-like glycosyltransferase
MMKLDRSLIKIFAIALLFRIIWAIAVPVIPLSDGKAYDVFAQNLASGNGYGWESGNPTAFWPPGTSFLYSLFYKVFGHTYFPIVVLNICLGVASIGLAMYLAKIWFNRSIALLTGLIIALLPSQIQYTTILASELIYNVVVLIALAFWFSDRLPLQVRAIISGITLAVASYVRPFALLLPLQLAFFRWFKTGQFLKTLKALLVMFALMAVLIFPWSMRNLHVFGHFVPISTNAGVNLWMGNNPNSKGQYVGIPSEMLAMNEAVRDRSLKSIAVKYIQENPKLFLKRCFTRLFDTHNRDSSGVFWNEIGLTQRYGQGILFLLKLICLLYWTIMLGSAMLGIVFLVKQQGWINAIAHPIIVFWSYYAAIHAIIVAQDRYHFPSVPFIAMLSAIGLEQIYLWLRSLQSTSKILTKKKSFAVVRR